MIFTTPKVVAVDVVVVVVVVVVVAVTTVLVEVIVEVVTAPEAVLVVVMVSQHIIDGVVEVLVVVIVTGSGIEIDVVVNVDVRVDIWVAVSVNVVGTVDTKVWVVTVEGPGVRRVSVVVSVEVLIEDVGQEVAAISITSTINTAAKTNFMLIPRFLGEPTTGTSPSNANIIMDINAGI